jgi:predicted phosphodiesterase
VHDILSEGNRKYLETLPEQISLSYNNDVSIRCVHGSPFSINEFIDAKNRALVRKCLESINERILLCGHTHVQRYDKMGNKYIINPGSVGLNYEGNATAQYAILDSSSGDIHIELYSVQYDINEVKARYGIDNPWNKLTIGLLCKDADDV